MIKMFGWEEKTRAQLRGKREEELGWIRKRFYLSLVNNMVKCVSSLCFELRKE